MTQSHSREGTAHVRVVPDLSKQRVACNGVYFSRLPFESLFSSNCVDRKQSSTSALLKTTTKKAWKGSLMLFTLTCLSGDIQAVSGMLDRQHSFCIGAIAATFLWRVRKSDVRESDFIKCKQCSSNHHKHSCICNSWTHFVKMKRLKLLESLINSQWTININEDTSCVCCIHFLIGFGFTLGFNVLLYATCCILPVSSSWGLQSLLHSKAFVSPRISDMNPHVKFLRWLTDVSWH